MGVGEEGRVGGKEKAFCPHSQVTPGTVPSGNQGQPHNCGSPLMKWVCPERITNQMTV